MSNISLTINKRYRYFFYCVLGLSLVTGIAFWLLRRFGMVEGDFGPESHFLQYPMLQIHGFSAFVMLMSLGAIFASHIPKTWSSGRARKSGLFILIATSFSIISAYILYYLVSEGWHEWLGNIHAVVGVLLPAILIVHIQKARLSRRKKKHKKAHIQRRKVEKGQTNA